MSTGNGEKKKLFEGPVRLYGMKDVGLCFRLANVSESGAWWKAECKADPCGAIFEVPSAPPSKEEPTFSKGDVNMLIGHYIQSHEMRRARRVR